MDSANVDRDALEEKLQDPTALPIPLPFEFLRDITSNFSDERQLGSGGYGVVYKGILRSGKIIAAKKLFEHLVDDAQFQKEVTNLVGVKHQNIVQLVGFCSESRSEAIAKLPSGTHVMPHLQRSLLCFEYLGNKCLDKHISDESRGLDWNQRFEIIKGICRGLHYLHGECNIVHLDLKPENILMDEAMTPKIADFGLSMLLGAQKSRTMISTGNVSGTLGYMAPEYQCFGVVSPKADIFSFGFIMVQIITGGKEYPMCMLPYYQEFDEGSSRQSTKVSRREYIDNVIGRWRDMFRKEPKYSPPEIYTEQVDQCLATALECLDYDPTKRPATCEISQMLTAEICSCQKKTLLSAQPLELRFRFTDKHEVTSSPLQLTNNTNDAVAFRIMANHREKYFLEPLYGLVLPRSTFTRRVAMYRAHELRFTVQLMCIRVGQLHPGVAENKDTINHFFTEANNKGSEVQQVKLRCAISYDDEIIPVEPKLINVRHMIVHPTKTWIIILTGNYLRKEVAVLDYQTQKRVLSSEFSAVDYFPVAFISRKQWIVTTVHDYIKVYDDRTMEEVKTFHAHKRLITSLDIHPSEPYVLSACSPEVKIWNWEKGWECVRTLLTAGHDFKFIPNNADYFAVTEPEGVKIWSMTSATDNNTFSFQTPRVHCLNYLIRGDVFYLVAGDWNGSVTIWNWQSRSCVKKVRRHSRLVSTVCVHPDLPIIITGSMDGTVCLMNSFTFELEGKLNCGLGYVTAIACLEGTNRIAIAHDKGLVITEIYST